MSRRRYIAGTTYDERCGFLWIDMAQLAHLRGDALFREMWKIQARRQKTWGRRTKTA